MQVGKCHSGLYFHYLNKNHQRWETEFCEIFLYLYLDFCFQNWSKLSCIHQSWEMCSQKPFQKRCILLLHIDLQQVVPAASGRFSECNQKLGLICQRETWPLGLLYAYFTLHTVLVADVFTWKKTKPVVNVCWNLALTDSYLVVMPAEM